MRLDSIPADPKVVYYRLFLDRMDVPYIACLQSFDEDSYHGNRFLTGDRFTEESEAIDALAPFRLAWLKGHKQVPDDVERFETYEATLRRDPTTGLPYWDDGEPDDHEFAPDVGYPLMLSTNLYALGTKVTVHEPRS